MALRLLFLGHLRDAAGEDERAVSYAARLDHLLAGLEPTLISALSDPRIKLAVNGALVTDTAGLILMDGDELAFLPPVSGG